MHETSWEGKSRLFCLFYAAKFFLEKINRWKIVLITSFTILFIINEDTKDIIKIVKSLEDSGVFIDGVTETIKHEIKKQDGRFPGALLAPLVDSLVQLVISSIVKGISGRGVRRAGRELMEKKVLVLLHPLSNIEINNYFNYEPRFNGVFSRICLE